MAKGFRQVSDNSNTFPFAVANENQNLAGALKKVVFLALVLPTLHSKKSGVTMTPKSGVH